MRSGRRTYVLAALLAVLALSSCAVVYAGVFYQFVASPGYYNGGTCYYLPTDASNQAWAQARNVNFTPLLANALYNSYLPQVYQVTNNAQGLVFSAEPSTTVSRSNYMPLWVLHTVTWFPNSPRSILKSVADVIAAKSAGRVSLTRTTTVIGASIVVTTAGFCIRQGSFVRQGSQVSVRLPVFGIFVDGLAYRTLMLDFSDRGEAQAFGGNYAQNLAQFVPLRIRGVLASWQNTYSMWIPASQAQLPVARQVPNPLGWQNANANYTPLMNEFKVRELVSPPPVYTSYAAIVGAALPTSVTNQFVFQPVLGQ